MSKNNPEVGDVVKAPTGDIFTVIDVSQYAIRVIGKYPYIKITTFTKNNYDIVFTYLGKSKTNIEDIFKMENE